MARLRLWISRRDTKESISMRSKGRWVAGSMAERERESDRYMKIEC